MRHAVVTRAAFMLVATLLAGALGFAWLVRGDVSPGGGDAFQRRCASCHTSSDLAGAMRVSGEARRAMDAFLRDHADASGQEAEQILDYFASAGSANGR